MVEGISETSTAAGEYKVERGTRVNTISYTDDSGLGILDLGVMRARWLVSC